MANGGKASAVSDATLALDTGANRWIALLTTLPTTNTGTSLVEVSGGAYARVAVTATTDWGSVTTAADNLTRQVSINTAKTWAAATASWGTIVGWALYDAVTAGNLRRWGPLVDGTGTPTSQAVSTGTTFQFAANSVTLKEA